MLSSVVFCIFLLSLASAFHSDHPDRSFAPYVPQQFLHNAHGSGFLDFPVLSIEDTETLAVEYAKLVINNATFVVKNSYEYAEVRNVYLRQTVNGFEVLNGDLNINVWERKVLGVGNSFFKGAEPSVTVPKLSSYLALQSLGKNLGQYFELSDLRIVDFTPDDQFKHTLSGYPNAVSDVKARLGYLQVDEGTRLELVWDFEVDVYDHWWNAFVSATTGEVLARYDWVCDDSDFNIYPVGVNDPSDGTRSVVNLPAKAGPSPLGWNDQGEGRRYVDTRGNNVYAQENLSGGTAWQNNKRPAGGAGLIFNFPINFAQQPANYLDASTTNLFYWNNIIHDIFWNYGFTEPGGNFQENNLGRGGLQNDAVQANSQDGSGTNNANFATPPDGQRPRMRMYVWTRTTPNRDGDLDSGIIVHEYAHGISNRLTGGPSNVNCLGTGEAGGMGEGWGDFYATLLRQRSSYVRTQSFPMGAYDTNTAIGIRKYPYTTNMQTNPETYSYIRRAGYEGVHAKGEVWCGILLEAYWNLRELLGFSGDWYSGEGGNNVMLRLVTMGMTYQPCRPNFVNARDAIFTAVQRLYNNDPKITCALWKGFAKRGLGTDASAGGYDGFNIPGTC